MIKKDFTMHSVEGMHLRTGMLLNKLCKNYSCDVNIIFNHNTINVGSVLNIVAACITQGSKFAITCDGDDEEKCMEAITEFSGEHFV